MAKLTPEERLAVLVAWRDSAAAAGHAVPTVDTLAAIVAANSVSAAPAGTESTVEPWAKTITFLLRQMNMGVVRPDLPSELETPDGAGAPMTRPVAVPAASVPASSAPASSAPAVITTAPVAAPESIADQRLEALRAWRDRAAEKGTEGIAALKDAHLRPIARSAFSSAAEIAAVLPNSATALAGAIADVLGGFGGSTAEAQPAVEVTDAAAVAAAAVVAAAVVAAPVVAAPAPSVAAPAPAPSPAASVAELPAGEFAPYGFAPQTAEPVSLRGTHSPGVGLVLTWPTYVTDNSVVLYRVVAHDEYAPYNPDQADLVSATSTLTATDSRPHTSAVRYAQVWVNTGVDVASAYASQPELYAQGIFVAQPLNIDVREDEGRVISKWSVWENIDRVIIYRIPIARAAQGSGSPEFQILVNDGNLGGFVDPDAVRGSEYLYQFWAETTVNGQKQLAAPISIPLRISDIIEQVADLAYTPSGDEDSPRFDLNWTAPRGGQVVIYRTEKSPTAGVDNAPLAETALEQAGLSLTSRLAHPIDRVPGGPSGMKNVPWPREWARAYFTPVTLLGDQAFVGKTIAAARVPDIRHAKLVERVNKQILTFSWPVGAATVLVYAGPIDQPAEYATQGNPLASISGDEYKELGGLRFTDNLPDRGCAVHLVPATFLGGERVEGNPITVIYPPLLRMGYETKFTRSLLGAITGVTVSITSARDLDSPPPFVVIHNPTRFPLSMQDGTALSVFEDGMEGVVSTKVFRPRGLSSTSPNTVWRSDSELWKTEVAAATGYLRLFVALEPERLVSVALLDPPPSQLRFVSLAKKMGLSGG